MSKNKNQIFITLDTTAPYLIQKKLIQKRTIIDGDLVIKDKSRMNKNIHASQKNGSSYLLKQPSVSNAYNYKFVEKEARFYSAIKTNSEFSSISTIIPRFVDYDKQNKILIMEFIPNTKALSYYDEKNQDYIRNFALLGKIIAMYHIKFWRQINNPIFSFLHKSLPLTLYIARPRPEILSVMSAANYELLKIIQHQTQISEFLEKIPDEWKVKTLIHGDAKLDNILVSVDKKREMRMKIIDWELVDFGDPAWDVAGIMSDIIQQNFFSLMNFDTRSKRKLDKQFELLMKKIKRPMSEFWKSYSHSLRDRKLLDGEFSSRVIRYCVAKLIQSAYDSLQWSNEVNYGAINMVNLSVHLIDNNEKTIQKILDV